MLVPVRFFPRVFLLSRCLVSNSPCACKRLSEGWALNSVERQGDRSSEYATAIKKGAPQAIQVADRWHLGKNLADSVSTLLARCRAEIRRDLHREAVPEQGREETDPMPEQDSAGEICIIISWRVAWRRAS